MSGGSGAGSRYLYVCEDGLVHYCSQQRGFPAIPLEKHTREHLEHEYHTQKSCALRCTVSAVAAMPPTRSAREDTNQMITLHLPLTSLCTRTPCGRAPRVSPKVAGALTSLTVMPGLMPSLATSGWPV